MRIRVATKDDLTNIVAIYILARQYMSEHGNPNQWGLYYPPQDVTMCDIISGNLYVIEKNDEVQAVFYFAIGEDKTYNVIENGNWLNDKPYGVIHRVASNGKIKGVLALAVRFAQTKIDNIKIDTHEDNKTMQHAIANCGFKRCGIIHTETGAPRIAYQLYKE